MLEIDTRDIGKRLGNLGMTAPKFRSRIDNARLKSGSASVSAPSELYTAPSSVSATATNGWFAPGLAPDRRRADLFSPRAGVISQAGIDEREVMHRGGNLSCHGPNRALAILSERWNNRRAST